MLLLLRLFGLALLVGHPGHARALAEREPHAASALPQSVPASLERRYRMDAKIRPLLVFWITRGSVGGALSGVPVCITYQPRWWFKAELVLDDRETF